MNDDFSSNKPLLVILIGLGIFVFAFMISSDDSLVSDSNGVVSSVYDFNATTVTVLDSSGKEVLATVSLEDYIIGVTCIEIGACSNTSLDEDYIKTQYIVARTFVLARSNYNSDTKSISVRSSTKDQGWCDLDNGCYAVKEGVYVNFYPADESHPADKYRVFSEEALELYHQYYQDTANYLYISNSKTSVVSSLSSNDAVYYKNSTQEFWKWCASKGKSYSEILTATANPASYGYSGYVADTASYANKYLYDNAKYSSSSSNLVGSIAGKYNGKFTIRTSLPDGSHRTNVFYGSEYAGENNRGQCVWYARGRACEIIDEAISDETLKSKMLYAVKNTRGNAMYWCNRRDTLGMFTQTTNIDEPRAGSLVVWTGGPYGHIAVIESVNADGTVNYSEGNINRDKNNPDNYGFMYRTNISIRGGDRGTIEHPFTGYTFACYIYLFDEE